MMAIPEVTIQEIFRILRRKEARERTGIPNATMYEMIKRGDFPSPTARLAARYNAQGRSACCRNG